MKLTRRQLHLLKELMIASGQKGNLPNASIILGNKGVVVGQSKSLVATNKDATSHAERLVIEQVCKLRGSPVIPGCRLISVLEPCLMCLAAAYWAGIKEIYYIVAASRYWDKMPWLAESKTIDKRRLIEEFSERIRYRRLAIYEADFSGIVDRYIQRVIPREV